MGGATRTRVTGQNGGVSFDPLSRTAPADADQRDIGRLTIQCHDQPGIVAAVAGFLAAHGANIIELGQYSTDAEEGEFFQRTVFHLPGLPARRDELDAAFAAEVGNKFSMSWRFTSPAVPKRVAIMVSKYNHALLELLWRNARGELDMEVGMVISNHTDLADEVRGFGIPFIHVPVSKQTKPEAEATQLGLLKGNFDLIVMARYMQILSDRFLDEVGIPIINIHHSFLPAFAGANPYSRAKERGVKLIGATAHYATAELDEGPIIEQDVVRVSHRESAAELERRGADVERLVLARAVKWHCEDRIMVSGRSTVIL